jgi:hypothetical protein
MYAVSSKLIYRCQKELVVREIINVAAASIMVFFVGCTSTQAYGLFASSGRLHDEIAQHRETSQKDLATQDILIELKAFQNYLCYSEDVINYEKKLHDPSENDFANRKASIADAISKLENTKLEKVEQQLAGQSRNLEVSIENLAQQLKGFEAQATTLESLKTISSLLNGIIEVAQKEDTHGGITTIPNLR